MRCSEPGHRAPVAIHAAHALLTPEAQQIHTPEAMKERVASMTAYAHEPVKRVNILPGAIIDEWPDKQYGDIAWVYVSLEGDSYAEAATVLLVETEHGIGIHDIEWGRP
jgi:hypothetical protein